LNDGARGLDVEIDDDHFLGTEVCQVDAERFSNSICSPCYDAYGSFGIEGAFVVTHFYTVFTCTRTCTCTCSYLLYRRTGLNEDEDEDEDEEDEDVVARKTRNEQTRQLSIVHQISTDLRMKVRHNPHVQD